MELITALVLIMLMILSLWSWWQPNSPWLPKGVIVLIMIVIMLLAVAHVRPFYGLGGR